MARRRARPRRPRVPLRTPKSRRHSGVGSRPWTETTSSRSPGSRLLLELAQVAAEPGQVALEHVAVAAGVLGRDVAESFGMGLAIEAVADGVVAVKVDHEERRSIGGDEHVGGPPVADVGRERPLGERPQPRILERRAGCAGASARAARRPGSRSSARTVRAATSFSRSRGWSAAAGLVGIPAQQVEVGRDARSRGSPRGAACPRRARGPTGARKASSTFHSARRLRLAVEATGRRVASRAALEQPDARALRAAGCHSLFEPVSA